MISSKNIMNNVQENQMEIETREVISKVLQIRKRIEDRPIDEWDMNSLIDHIYTLCKFMGNISDMKDYAYIESQALAEEYKSAVRDEYIKIKNSGEKVTDKMAESMAEQRCDGIRQQALEAEHRSRWLKSFYDDCDRLISLSQSKVKSEVDGRIRANIE